MTAAFSLPAIAPEAELALRATLLMGATWASAAALRKFGAPAAARHTAWLLGIAALLALPVIWWFAPALSLPILPAEAAATMAETAGHASAASAPAQSLPSDLAEYGGWRSLLFVSYALVALALMFRLILGQQLLGRLWRNASPVPGEAWDDLLSQLSSEMAVRARVELRVSSDPAMPMTWGTLEPKVLLPAEATSWPSERLRLVLLHELAHVARRDSLSRSMASMVCSLYWFHPGAWFAARRMRMEQEHAADDRVLTAGGSAEAYARDLLHVASAMSQRSQPKLAATMAGAGQLERRLVSITSPAPRHRPSPAFLFSLAMLAALATLALASGVPVSKHRPRSHPLQPGPAAMTSPTENSVHVRRTRNPSGIRDTVRSALERSAPVSRPSSASLAVQPLKVNFAGEEPRPEPNTLQGNTAHIPPAQERRGPATDHPEQLPDYGWKLPHRASRAPVESPPASTRSARLPSLAGPVRGRDATGRPAWPPVAARIIPAGTPGRTRAPAAPGGLMLSWSPGAGER